MEELHVDFHLSTDADCGNSGFIRKYHKGKEVRICTTLLLGTIGRTLLAQGNLVVTRSVHAADAKEYNCSSRNTFQTATYICALHMLIPGVSFTTSRISSSTSEVVDLSFPLLVTRGAKFPYS
jgi:hypothetical protein